MACDGKSLRVLSDGSTSSTRARGRSQEGGFVADGEGNHEKDIPATIWTSTVAGTVAIVTPMLQPVEKTGPPWRSPQIPNLFERSREGMGRFLAVQDDFPALAESGCSGLEAPSRISSSIHAPPQRRSRACLV